jgi:hypothetical protein
VGNDGHDDRGDTGQQRRDLRPPPVLDVEPGQDSDDDHRRKQEREACNDEPGPAGPAMTDVHRQLGGGRPRDQVRRADQVDEHGVVEPAAAPDELVAHDRDVPGRTTEGRQPDAQERRGEVAQRGLRAHQATGRRSPRSEARSLSDR